MERKRISQIREKNVFIQLINELIQKVAEPTKQLVLVVNTTNKLNY